jgi:hypothetical protein
MLINGFIFFSYSFRSGFIVVWDRKVVLATVTLIGPNDKKNPNGGSMHHMYQAVSMLIR